MQKIIIFGQGYVGLPLAINACEVGFDVTGIEINRKVADMLNSGQSHIEDISDIKLKEAINTGRYRVVIDLSEVKEVDTILICVPTPLDSKRKPNLEMFVRAIAAAATMVKHETLVIIESTIEPGTTRNIVTPMIESISGIDREFFDISFSPERIDPNNATWRLHNTAKLVAGLTIKATKKTLNFYSNFVSNIHVCESLEIAETAKLLENTFRLVNISFINEMAIFCRKIGIDIDQVIKAAATKPYGFMPFYPSIGVGGHCIPVDPLYLANKAIEIGSPIRFIDLADQINEEMPGYFVGIAEEKLDGLRNRKVLVVGVSYKPNVADIRETPVEALITGLKQKGAQVVWHDDLVKEWNGDKSVALSSDFDLAIIATHHDYLDLKKLGNMPILNTRGSI